MLCNQCQLDVELHDDANESTDHTHDRLLRLCTGENEGWVGPIAAAWLSDCFMVRVLTRVGIYERLGAVFYGWVLVESFGVVLCVATKEVSQPVDDDRENGISVGAVVFKCTLFHCAGAMSFLEDINLPGAKAQ